MPTQEERLTELEQKTAAHIQEMDENFTIMVGVIRHQGQDIKRIFQRLETIDERLNILKTIDERLETTDKRLHTIEERLDRIETSFDEHTTLLTEILARLPKVL